MRVRLPGMLLVLAAGLLVAADGADDKAKAELKKLEGTWNVKTVTVDGQDRTADYGDLKMVIKKDGEFVVRQGDKDSHGGIFTVNPDKKPKWIDNKYTSGAYKGKVELGIYELDGGKLKFCFSSPDGKERPAEFTSKEGSGFELTTLERQEQ
jgi:uncharacterized protein (TIGR03067 family)